SINSQEPHDLTLLRSDNLGFPITVNNTLGRRTHSDSELYKFSQPTETAIGNKCHNQHLGYPDATDGAKPG
uniref:Uncharacterized protein n=1 Tax=Syphacia muris TaxID=451379 RepID=A0A0N5ACL9_9BILA